MNRGRFPHRALRALRTWHLIPREKEQALLQGLLDRWDSDVDGFPPTAVFGVRQRTCRALLAAVDEVDASLHARAEKEYTLQTMTCQKCGKSRVPTNDPKRMKRYV